MPAFHSSDQPNDEREIPDSEENSPIDARSPDQSHERTVVSKNPPPPPPPPPQSPRTLELQQKIARLRSTIQTTELQLGEALGKRSALPSFHTPSSTTQPTKALSAHSNTMPGLSPDQHRTLAQAQTTLDRHIKALGKYNQLKDIAMGMLGLIAEKEGKTLREVMEARDVDDDD